MKKSSTSDFVVKESAVSNQPEKDAEYDLHVGLDVHKASIAVAVAERGRGPAQFRSEIANTPKGCSGSDFQTRKGIFNQDYPLVIMKPVPAAMSFIIN